MKKLSLLLLAIFVASQLFAGPEERDHSRRIVFEKYLFAEGVNPKARNLSRLKVKFFDEDMVRLRDNKLVSTNGRAALAYTSEFLARHPEIQVLKNILNKTEEAYAEQLRFAEERSGWDLVDGMSFYLFKLPNPADDPRALLQDILKAPEVEIAYYESIPIDLTCQDLGNPSPDYRPNQNYHDPAPLGTDLDYALSTFGEVADGVSTTWVGIFERGMQTTHEDFDIAVVSTAGTPDADNDHGTAVTGIMGGCFQNLVGVLGYVEDEAMHLFQRNSSSYGSTADIYNFANGLLVAGEVTTNSWGYGSDPMPPGQNCPCNPGQNGLVCPEYEPDVKAEIEAGVAEGIHYFLSAGNGCVNMDDATFGSTFRYSTDTGSNYVGAVKSTLPHDSSCYTNWGERVDVCGWGDGIYSTGYDNTPFVPASRDEWYTDSFNGTSGAGPIVAGCAGVLNNLYRDQHAGTNLAPSTMRTWLRINGTEAGTFPGADDPEMPNLFGITAPELNPDIRSGWYTYFVPRNTGDADGSSAPLPGTLNSSPSTTYWNAAWENESHFGTATPGNIRFLRDDVALFVSSYANMAPEQRGYTTNVDFGASTEVRGGRHTGRMVCDYNNDVAEQDEDNNEYTRQYVWNPRQTTGGSVYQFSSPPLDVVTGQLPTWPDDNCDGYAGENWGSDGWWDILAVMAEDAASDYDAYVYSDTSISSTTGFTTYAERSFLGGGSVDFVGVNNNVVGGNQSTTLLAAANNFNDGTSDYRVHSHSTAGLGMPTSVGRLDGGTHTLNSVEIFESWEFYANALVPYNIEVEVTGGTANIALDLFGPSNIYFGRDDYLVQANANGAGGGESILCWTPPAVGWYCIVVTKNSSLDWGTTSDFHLYYGKAGYDLEHWLVSGWSHEIVPRQVSGAFPATLPATLTGNVTNNYWNSGYRVTGCVNSPGGILNNYFLVDGYVVDTTGNWAAHAPVSETFWGNQDGTQNVFGGRHTVGDIIDCFNEGDEYREDNNRLDAQYVWTPFSLANQSPLLKSSGAPNWRDSDSEPQFSNYNLDGYSFSGTTWSGVAICPTSTTDDLNLFMYDPTTGSENGFSTELATSWVAPGGGLEFVVENGNTNGNPRTYNAGVHNNYTLQGDTSDGGYRLYQCNSLGLLANNAYNGIYTLAANHLMHVRELDLTAGDTTRIFLDNLGVNDLGLAIFDPTDTYGSRGLGGTYANLNGNSGDETISFIPASTGRHAVVVFKNDNTDFGSNNYALIIGDRTPQTPDSLVIQVINSQSAVDTIRLAWPPVTADVNGAPLTPEAYRIYYSLTPNNVFPAGWTYYINGVSPQRIPVSGTVLYVRFLITATDTDGFILSHSPLPGDENLIGMKAPGWGDPPQGTAESPPLIAPR